MKTNLKYQNGRLPQEPPKKTKRTSLGWCALTVLGLYLLCSILLSPTSEELREKYNYMLTDVEYNGTLTHKLTLAGSQVLFYLSSLLSTVAFFFGASYIVNFRITRAKEKAIGASVITLLGMNVSTLLPMLAFAVLIMRDSGISLPDSFIETVLINGVFSVVCTAGVTLLIFLLASKKAPLYLFATISATVMFVCAAGLELFDNIPFFLNGTVLTEDVVKMILSMLIYVLHAFIGFVIMLKMTKRPKTK